MFVCFVLCFYWPTSCDGDKAAASTTASTAETRKTLTEKKEKEKEQEKDKKKGPRDECAGERGGP